MTDLSNLNEQQVMLELTFRHKRLIEGIRKALAQIRELSEDLEMVKHQLRLLVETPETFFDSTHEDQIPFETPDEVTRYGPGNADWERDRLEDAQMEWDDTHAGEGPNDLAGLNGP